MVMMGLPVTEFFCKRVPVYLVKAGKLLVNGKDLLR